jgi:murein DD-endopeptidase MepM/ murein hydrolase activator NlpD
MKFFKNLVVFVILFCFFFVLSTSVFADKRIELQKIRQDLNDKKLELHNSKMKEKEIKKEVSYISTNLKKTVDNIKVLEQSLNAKQSDYEEQISRLNQEKIKEAYYRKILKKELEFLYKQKFVNNNVFLSTVNAFFLNDNFYKEIEKEYNIKTFLFYNKNKYKHTLFQQDVIKTNQVKIEKDITVLSQKKEVTNKTKINLLTEKQKKQLLLAEEKNKQKIYQEQIVELNKSAKKLENFISDLSNKKRGNLGRYSEIINRFGYIPMPVSGFVIVNYGKNKHPKYDTYRISNGIEIETKQSLPVKAVLSGKVVFSDKFSSYGNTVIIEHPEQIYTVYAYLEKLNVKNGATVTKGTIIGYSGFSTISNVDALYFEVRVNGVAMDPLVWIRK